MAIRPYRSTTDIFRPFFDDIVSSNFGGRLAGIDLLRTPESDVLETKNEIRVTMELPGVPADHVDVNLEDNVLTVTGEKQETREESEKDERRWHLSERRYGRFTRSFVLPREVDTDRIAASFENGILTVTIPKSERVKPRKIEIRESHNAHEIEG